MNHDNVAKIVFDLLKIYDYHLVTKKEIQAAYSGGREINIVGLTDFETKNIYILKTQNFSDMEATIAHEFVHAYLDGLGLDKTNDELYVEQLANKWRKSVYKR
jgi:uncharacterized protein YjaZ